MKSILHKLPLALFTLLLGGMLACNNTHEPLATEDFDPKARIICTLGEINLDQEQTSELSGRAGSTKALANGQTFRLYALRSGAVNAEDIIISYTYTMVNGKPVMDAGQGDGKLYLPYGNLDIYLAGPVSVASDNVDSEGAPIPVQVASPIGVIPQQGVDLIASRTQVNIKYTGENTLSPLPLKHKMAKVKVRVKLKDNDAIMKKLVLTKVELHNQYNGVGEYLFDEQGGSIPPTSVDAESGISFVQEGKDIVTAVAEKEYYVTFMLLPRTKGSMKIDLEMNITTTIDGVTKTELYRMSGIVSNIDLVGGMQNRIYTEPVVSADILWRPTLLPWDNEEPIAPPMGGELALYLDGRDAPEMINGKLCWRDRSGNGYHAEIISKNILYNKEESYYFFPSYADLMQVPSMGMLPDYTVEITLATIPNTGNVLFFNSDNSTTKRDLFMHVPYGSGNDCNTFFDSGEINADPKENSGRISTLISADYMFYHTFRTYFFRKTLSAATKMMSMGVNGVEKEAKERRYEHGAFIYNKIGGMDNMKIRALRIYRKYLADAELKENYNADNSIYKQDPSVVSDGLILHLDGKVAPFTDKAGNTFWPDISGNSNHAQYHHRSASSKKYISHTKYGYNFSGLNSDECSYLKLLKTLGTNKDYTLEIVTNSKKERTTIFHSGPSDADAKTRAVCIHLPITPLGSNTLNRIVFDGPSLDDGAQRNRITYTGPYSNLEFTSKTNYYAFIHSESITVNRMMINGEQVANTKSTLTMPDMTYTYIGNLNQNWGDWFIGDIYAIRLYNKVLTFNEMLKNSRADHARYKF